LAVANCTPTLVSCALRITNNLYTCHLNDLEIADDEGQEIRFENSHTNDRTNADVESIMLVGGNVPFLFPQIFETFPNLVRMNVANSGTKRIPSHSLANATNLKLMIFERSPLTDIKAYAFSGASNLLILDLFGNQVTNVDENAFAGLSNLRDLLLENNRIRRLSANTFRPLKNVEVISLSDNNIATLYPKTFSENRHLRNLAMIRNRINEIDRTIIEGLNKLEFFNVFENRCVNQMFVIDGPASREEINKELNECFTNFEAIGKLRLEVRGKITISDDYENCRLFQRKFDFVV
jgi:Leucine-rich repeat (LRR) protein